MNRFQNVSFKSIDDFLEYLPKHELKIVQILRSVILDNIPECIEKLAYQVPFYYKNKRICFIWPSSVPWGNVKKDGVMLGFCQGHLFENPLDMLEKGNRKQILSATFTDSSQIDENMVKFLIHEACTIDMKFKKK